ncbi:ubiquitin-like protein ATG12 [Cryptococcus amylolentus CBS 6039]|uniref:Ubiquitin-like protein ATG12 n=2 Tax=Cryptococcus TaxID=5206 RepID=A0A1E3HQQ6_9TREE|nr:ubiquitin-like protein ATG12 [Cryptococcus amylolentus CBS 6039]ODN78700.1 ubiquitin-like protein ATG12 [Cryptococcus amylolentus CBS 6039]
MASGSGFLSHRQEPSGESSTVGTHANSKSASLDALDEYKKKDPAKVVVRFKSIGSAPIMKNNVFKATAGHKFQAVIMFLRQQLGTKKEDSLFTYINAAFAPAPDDTVGNLYKAFGTEGHLIVNYSNTQAWG